MIPIPSGLRVAVARESGAGPKEARRRAEATVMAIQGAVVLAAALDDEEPFKAMLSDLPRMMLHSGVGSGLDC